MKRIDNAKILVCDVDGTLIKPLNECTEQELFNADRFIDIHTPWGKETFYELHHMTARIRRQHMQGHHITVWSQGGVDWAETVVKHLGLQDCVDIVSGKPTWYFDDLPADEWMKRTIP
jgi:phosphoserine phosphatase